MIIASGTGEIEVIGLTISLEPGDMMYAEANVLHGIKNTGSTVMDFYFTKILAAS
jgi:mannose-6-phosphate isomerase-like protein (cupin superfamily)